MKQQHVNVPQFDWEAYPDAKTSLSVQDIEKAQLYLLKKAYKYEMFLNERELRKQKSKFQKDLDQHVKYERKFNFVMGRLTKQMQLDNVDENNKARMRAKYIRDRLREVERRK